LRRDTEVEKMACEKGCRFIGGAKGVGVGLGIIFGLLLFGNIAFGIIYGALIGFFAVLIWELYKSRKNK